VDATITTCRAMGNPSRNRRRSDGVYGGLLAQQTLPPKRCAVLVPHRRHARSTRGYLLIVDRKKDIIVRAERISLPGTRKALLAHPAVLEAGVIPVPDEKWGEVPKALVVLKRMPRHGGRTHRVLPCALSHYKCPRSFDSSQACQDRHWKNSQERPSPRNIGRAGIRFARILARRGAAAELA